MVYQLSCFNIITINISHVYHFRIRSGLGSDGRNLDSVGNGATDGTTHNSSVQQNTNNEHSGHNNTGDHNSLAQSGGASTHEGMISIRLLPNTILWLFKFL